MVAQKGLLMVEHSAASSVGHLAGYWVEPLVDMMAALKAALWAGSKVGSKADSKALK